MRKSAIADRGNLGRRKTVVRRLVRRKTLAEWMASAEQAASDEREFSVADYGAIKVVLREREFSQFAAFRSGAALALGVSPRHALFNCVFKERKDPWHVVGDCFVQSLKRTVANAPHLPPLPADLFFISEDPSQKEMIEHPSA